MKELKEKEVQAQNIHRPKGPSYRLEVEVMAFKEGSYCRKGHKVGDKFIVSPLHCGDFCGSAFHVIYPMLQTMGYGGKFPWNPEGNEIYTACPDFKNQMTMKITRTLVEPGEIEETPHE